MVDDRVKKAVLYTAIFSVLSLGVMFYRAATKSIIIAEATQTMEADPVLNSEIPLVISTPTSDKGRGQLVIPLETGVSSENITFEEKHAEHEFFLYIDGKTSDFYDINSPVSDLSIIKGATLMKLNDSGRVCLKFALDGLYENQTALGDREITVSFIAPADLYEKTVVIEPVDDTGLEIVKYLKKKFDAETDIKVFYTGQNSSDDTDEAVDELIADAAADFYIQVGADNSAGTESGIKTYYNGRFFIRDFGNVELADQLEKNTATVSAGRALGLFESDKDNTRLMESKIPSAFVAVGNMNSAEDAERLGNDSYLENCAAGIAEGIKASFNVASPAESADSTDALQGIITGN